MQRITEHTMQRIMERTQHNILQNIPAPSHVIPAKAGTWAARMERQLR